MFYNVLRICAVRRNEFKKQQMLKAYCTYTLLAVCKIYDYEKTKNFRNVY